jgi:hypothetical protein
MALRAAAYACLWSLLFLVVAISSWNQHVELELLWNLQNNYNDQGVHVGNSNATVLLLNENEGDLTNASALLSGAAQSPAVETAASLGSIFSKDEKEDVALARFANGSIGYIADPTALRRGISAFLKQPYDNHNNHSYWHVLKHYQEQYRRDALYGNESLTADNVCFRPPGQGWEGGTGAYALLTEKIMLAADADSTTTTTSPKVLCAIYTHAPLMRDLARAAAITWGSQCDGFLAFSNQTVELLGMVDLLHKGPEAYQNMWQKTRSIWKYIHQHYLEDYDYFHLGGDDLFMLVPNLRHFVATLPKNAPVFAGQWTRQKNRPYLSGGPGYTLNREALRRYIENVWEDCYPNAMVSYEDRLISKCMEQANVELTDTRDVAKAEQQYHDCPPQQVYNGRPSAPGSRRRNANFHSRGISYWETLPYPNASASSLPVWQLATSTSNKSGTLEPVAVGPKYGLEAAGKYSVSFHQIQHPLFMARLHAILYPGICPPDSPLGRARQQQQSRN